jgi:hypothetical protein
MSPAAAPMMNDEPALILEEKDLESKHLSHESVSSLFKAWQSGWDDDVLALEEEHYSPTSVRQVLEVDDEKPDILELPPLSQAGAGTDTDTDPTITASPTPAKRPLCTFLNFRGTRLAEHDEEESLPSLYEEDLFQSASSCLPEINEKVSLELPPIDDKLKDDEQMKEYVTKFEQLVAEAKKVEKEITEIEQKRKKQRIE